MTAHFNSILSSQLWNCGAWPPKDFQRFSVQKTAIQRPSYELLYKGNVSSNDNDEHLQVTRTKTNLKSVWKFVGEGLKSAGAEGASNQT